MMPACAQIDVARCGPKQGAKVGFEGGIGSVRRQQDGDLAGEEGDDFGEAQIASSLDRPTLAQGQQLAEAAVSGPVLWIADHLRAVARDQPRSHQQRQVGFLGRRMGAHHPGQGVAVGHAERRQPQCLGRRDQLLGVRSGSQEREVGRRNQLGVGRRRCRPHYAPETLVATFGSSDGSRFAATVLGVRLMRRDLGETSDFLRGKANSAGRLRPRRGSSRDPPRPRLGAATIPG